MDEKRSNVVSLDYYRNGKNASDEMTRHSLTQLRDEMKKVIYGSKQYLGMEDYQDLDSDISKIILKFKMTLLEYEDYISRTFKK